MFKLHFCIINNIHYTHEISYSIQLHEKENKHFKIEEQGLTYV